jgi:hypothetical protein
MGNVPSEIPHTTVGDEKINILMGVRLGMKKKILLIEFSYY